MTAPSQKQISYAEKLGIEQPDQYDMKTLSKMIDAKLGGKPKNTPTAQPAQTSEHSIVISRVEKPHSYEFGKASARHKIYYATIKELKEHYDSLKENGFIELEDEVEHVRM